MKRIKEFIDDMMNVSPVVWFIVAALFLFIVVGIGLIVAK